MNKERSPRMKVYLAPRKQERSESESEEQFRKQVAWIERSGFEFNTCDREQKRDLLSAVKRASIRYNTR